MTRALVVLQASLVCLACSPHTSDQITRRVDSAGVSIAISPGNDVPLGWRFERLVTMGQDTLLPSLSSPGIGVDNRGSIYVLDDAHGRVLRFDTTGALTRTLGRKGAGPGELDFPFILEVQSTGVVNVFDAAKQTFVRFDSNGGTLPNLPVAGRFGGGVAITTWGIILATMEPDSQKTLYARLVQVDSGNRVIAGMKIEDSKAVKFPGCPMEMALPPLFAPQLIWKSSPSQLLVNRTAQYEIESYQGHRMVRVIRRDTPARKGTDQLAAQEASNGMRVTSSVGECRIGPDEVVRARGYATQLPAIADLSVDNDGRLWVERFHVKGETPLVDVFDADGVYLGTLPPGSPFPVGFLPGHRILAIESDSSGADLLTIYRFKPGQS